MVLFRLAFFWSSQYNIFWWEEFCNISLENSDNPVDHYEHLWIVSKYIFKYLFIDTYNAAPFIWVKINCYINYKVALFPILNDGP